MLRKSHQNKKLALNGGNPIRTKPFPKYNTISDEEKEEVMKILDSGELSGFAAIDTNDFYGGNYVTSLEKDFCEYFSSPHAIAVNSATSALHIAVASMNIGPGDEVIVPPYTMTATPTSVLLTGAVPIFADILEDTYCLDPDSVVKNINKNTKGIIVVNLFGHPAPLIELKKIADAHGLFLIEDNAQAPGTKINGSYTGTIGDAGIFSFNRHKVIQCGEGGLVICKDPEKAFKMQLIRNHGECLVDKLGAKDIINVLGVNYRMPNIEAAITRIQFRKLEVLNAHRIKIANYFSKRLMDIDGLEPPIIRKDCTHGYYVFAIKYKKDVIGINKELFAKAVQAEGFLLKSGYTRPLYMTPLYQKQLCFGSEGYPFKINQRISANTYKKGICPITEKIEEYEMLWTPLIYPPISEADIDQFVEALIKVIQNVKDLKNKN